MVAITTIFVVAAILVALIVVPGRTRRGWMSQSANPEYQRGDEALRTW